MKPKLFNSVNTLITYYSQTGNSEKIAIKQPARYKDFDRD